MAGDNVIYGVVAQVALYGLYVTTGIAFLANDSLRAKVPHTWGNPCFRQYLVYCLIAILLASRVMMGVIKSYYLYKHNLPTQPTRRDVFIRVAAKIYIFLHGLILWVAPSHSCRQGVQATDINLWRFYALTVWANCASVILLPVVLSSSLQKARSDRQEQPLRGNGPLPPFREMESQESISDLDMESPARRQQQPHQGDGYGGGDSRPNSGRSNSIFGAYNFRQSFQYSNWNGIPAIFNSNSSARSDSQADGFYDARAMSDDGGAHEVAMKNLHTRS